MNTFYVWTIFVITWKTALIYLWNNNELTFNLHYLNHYIPFI